MFRIFRPAAMQSTIVRAPADEGSGGGNTDTSADAAPAADAGAALGASDAASPEGEGTDTLGAGDKSEDKANDAGSDDQSADDKSADDKSEGDKSEDDKETGAPESYDLKTPDEVQVDPAALESFQDVAKDLDLSNEDAQKLLDWDIERGMKAMEEGAKAFDERVAKWDADAQADKELGGEAMPEKMSLAKRAADTFGSPEFAKLLEKPSPENPEGLGLGKHPEVRRLLYRVGQAISDDKLVAGEQSSPASTREQRMYPTMNQDS